MHETACPLNARRARLRTNGQVCVSNGESFLRLLRQLVYLVLHFFTNSLPPPSDYHFFACLAEKRKIKKQITVKNFRECALWLSGISATRQNGIFSHSGHGVARLDVHRHHNEPRKTHPPTPMRLSSFLRICPSFMWRAIACSFGLSRANLSPLLLA